MPASATPSHASKELLIDVDNLSVVRGGETAVNSVSFCVHSGEFIGLVGPNGAGKTTLLRAMLGLIKPTKGRVSKLPERIGYIPQRGSLHDSLVPMSVLEVVRLGAGRDAAAAQTALRDVDLADYANQSFSKLSGGQQQRVLIAKALAAQPEVLILDEPTTGVDERSQTEFFQILARLQKRGLAIIMVSHDVDAVLKLVTRVMCLNVSMLYDGAPEHFEADKYLPRFYTEQHRHLHHEHGTHRA